MVLGPVAALMFVPGQFSWWLAVPYLALNGLLFLGPYTLCLHNTSHRPLFKPRYRALRQIVPWVWGPLFGQTPESYYAHHMGMHHAAENMPDDASTTMPFTRDSAADFLLRYWGHFMTVGTAELSRFLDRANKQTLRRRFLIGEAIYATVVLALLWANWRPTLVVLVIPMLLIRFLMMAGNWGQHAFIDAADPSNPYKNSITCINAIYNRQCFNDGYHIGHHVNMTRHWTEMPGDFLKNIDEYARQGAIVFQDIDFNGVWFALMLKRYDWLARRYVDLSGKGLTEPQIIELLKSRTRPIPAVAEPSLQAA